MLQVYKNDRKIWQQRLYIFPGNVATGLKSAINT